MEKEKNFISALKQIPIDIEKELLLLPKDIASNLEEVRLRIGEKIIFCSGNKKYYGNVICCKTLLTDTLNSFLRYSYYAYEEELKNGYITLHGGHRAGLCGKVIVANGNVEMIKDISSINLRHCREFKGISDEIIPTLFDKQGQFLNTLIVSPPKCGKTTFIRDIVRNLSNRGLNISVCDERSEIAGMCEGESSFDLGKNTDVMDGCPKARGMIMMLRAMAPDIVVTDEIGKPEDIVAINALMAAGVGFITTIHGGSIKELKRNEVWQLVEKGAFERIIFLTSKPKPCTVVQILGGRDNA